LPHAEPRIPGSFEPCRFADRPGSPNCCSIVTTIRTFPRRRAARPSAEHLAARLADASADARAYGVQIGALKQLEFQGSPSAPMCRQGRQRGFVCATPADGAASMVAYRFAAFFVDFFLAAVFAVVFFFLAAFLTAAPPAVARPAAFSNHLGRGSVKNICRRSDLKPSFQK
jgi:hypothetical protein